MPTQKQILASIDERLGAILAAVQKPVVAPPVVAPPQPLPTVPPPVVQPPVVPPSQPPVVSGATRSRPAIPAFTLKTPAEIFASRLMVPFDRQFVRGGAQTGKALTYQPGVWPGYTDMGATGERDELGLVTGSIGEWLCGGSPNNMLVYAEAHGQVPIHFRDKAGDLVSIVKEPKASCYYDPRAVSADPWYQVTGTVKPDTSHYPAACYVAFLATGDLYYLEELQSAAVYHSLVQNPGYRGYAKGLLDTEQTRGYAWALRDIASAYLATPDVTPPGLHPKAYFKAILDANRDNFLATWVRNGAGNSLTGCHFAVRLANDQVGPWQQDMLGIVLGWMVYTGQFPDWRPIYEWHIRQAIDRTSGKSGYPRSRAVAYYYKTHKQTGVDAAGDPIFAPAVGTMRELAAFNGLTETPDGNYPPGTDTAYRAYLRMNLKIAMLNGIPDAAECFAYADSQTPYIEPKWAV